MPMDRTAAGHLGAVLDQHDLGARSLGPHGLEELPGLRPDPGPAGSAAGRGLALVQGESFRERQRSGRIGRRSGARSVSEGRGRGRAPGRERGPGAGSLSAATSGLVSGGPASGDVAVPALWVQRRARGFRTALGLRKVAAVWLLRPAAVKPEPPLSGRTSARGDGDRGPCREGRDDEPQTRFLGALSPRPRVPGAVIRRIGADRRDQGVTSDQGARDPGWAAR
jgi:hypothetical protein